MASGKTSKNARTSKPKEFVKPVKERKKKEYLYIELTTEIAKELKDTQELSSYKGMEIIEIKKRFGKQYLYCRVTI